MCGRFTLSSSAARIAEAFSVEAPATLPPRFNIAPSQHVLAVREKHAATKPTTRERELVTLQWGFVPMWARDPASGSRMINARSETAATKPAFRASFRSQRCLVVADGFYEWQVDPDTGKKQPWYIRLRSGLPFGIAGLMSHWKKPGKPAIESCALLTCEPNELMVAIHDRMPVIVPPESFDAWLDGEEGAEGRISGLLRPFDAAQMLAYRVSTLVNSPRHDSAKCVEPVSEIAG